MTMGDWLLGIVKSLWGAISALPWAVLGTWVIAIVAIWGEPIRGLLLKPRIKVDVLNPRGSDLIDINYPDGTQAIGRFFHLKVANERPLFQATQIQVWILRLSKEGPTGQPETVLSEPVPLRWRHQQVQPLRMTIGPIPGQADLLCVTNQNTLQLQTLFTPNNFPTVYKGRTRIWLTVQAQGDKYSGQLHEVEIAWDGTWDQGEAELVKHLKISVRAERK